MGRTARNAYQRVGRHSATLCFAFLSVYMLAGCGNRPAPASSTSRVETPNKAACPAQDFEGFLKAYASDPLIRERFTAPVLKVADISEDGEGGYALVTRLVAAEDYDGFLLSYRNAKFGFIGDEEAEADDPRLPLIITLEPNGAYFVTFPDNVEAISYRFERHGDCWRLTEDPEATP